MDYSKSWTQPGQDFFNEAIDDRVKERFPKLSSAGVKKLAQVVKQKGQIDSKLYVYLGNLYDKLKNPKKFLITNNLNILVI